MPESAQLCVSFVVSSHQNVDCCYLRCYYSRSKYCVIKYQTPHLVSKPHLTFSVCMKAHEFTSERNETTACTKCEWKTHISIWNIHIRTVYMQSQSLRSSDHLKISLFFSACNAIIFLLNRKKSNNFNFRYGELNKRKRKKGEREKEMNRHTT